MKNKKLKYCAPVLGAILLTGCGGGDSDSSSTGTQSSALEVTAGENITTYGKHTVTLIGEATDSDSEITSVEWSQSSDDSLQLTIVDSQTLTPTIEIPDIYTSEDVNLTLTVTNDDGEVVSDSVLVSLLPAEHSLSVALTGFGESLKVTNAEQEVVSGSLASDYPINSLTLINKTTNIQYQIDPTDTWQAGITLVEGDNDLEVSATSEDGTEISVETTVTYNELMDFTSSLSFDHPIIYTDQESVDVTAMIGSSNSQNPTMSLVDAEGNSISVLVDDGQLPDEIEGDGIFTASFTLTPSSEEELCFRVKATNSDESSYSSEQQCIWSLDPLVPEEVGTSVAIADNVELMVEQALEQGKTEAEALIFVLTDLQQNQNVGQAGVTGEGGLWWITESGILGLYHQSIEGSKRGSNSGVIGAAPSLKAPFVPQYYTANSFNSSTNYIALSSGDEVSLSTMSATDEANRIQSSKSIIVSPYINNPDDINNSFGTNDDYYSVWQTLKNSGSACKLEASNEAINNGSVAVSIDSFKDYSNFGYIHISTHGDNFYQGLFSLWEPTWGPNDFLRGALSQVALYTGIVLPVATNGEYDITGYEDDIQAKRIAIGGGGSIVLLPGFFKHYLTSMPNSLVVLSACRSMYNNSLANVLLSKGAGAVMGFDNYVLTSYAQNTTDHIISEMLNSDSTFGDAVNSAVNSYGANDGQLSPAALKVARSWT